MANPKAPITDGVDRSFFEKVTVTSTAFGDGNGDANTLITLRFIRHFSLVNEGGVVIEYSFNGNTLHGDLTPGTPTAAIIFDNRPINKIWFRLIASGSGIVRIEAWGD